MTYNKNCNDLYQSIGRKLEKWLLSDTFILSDNRIVEGSTVILKDDKSKYSLPLTCNDIIMYKVHVNTFNSLELSYLKAMEEGLEFTIGKKDRPLMNLEEALKFMKDNPFTKVTMPTHYKSWQYNYYDDARKKFLIETGDVWDIDLSIEYGESEGYQQVAWRD